MSVFGYQPTYQPHMTQPSQNQQMPGMAKPGMPQQQPAPNVPGLLPPQMPQPMYKSDTTTMGSGQVGGMQRNVVPTISVNGRDRGQRSDPFAINWAPEAQKDAGYGPWKNITAYLPAPNQGGSMSYRETEAARARYVGSMDPYMRGFQDYKWWEANEDHKVNYGDLGGPRMSSGHAEGSTPNDRYLYGSRYQDQRPTLQRQFDRFGAQHAGQWDLAAMQAAFQRIAQEMANAYQDKDWRLGDTSHYVESERNWMRNGTTPYASLDNPYQLGLVNPHSDKYLGYADSYQQEQNELRAAYETMLKQAADAGAL